MKNKESFAVGGQAVIEGVMMRNKNFYSLAVRNVNTNDITVEIQNINFKNYKLLNLPIIRGVVAFWQSLILGTKIIMKSAKLSGLEDSNNNSNSKIEKWLENKFGDKLTDFIVYISVIFSIFLSILLFMVFPVWISAIFHNFFTLNNVSLSILEGLFRALIFFSYILIISKLKDVNRIFMYHGAEHKTINCYESGQELTLKNVKNQTRIHKRCGTSFLILVIIISIIFFMFFKTTNPLYRIITRIIFVPIIAGISYEIIKIAGSKNNLLINLISKPGMLLQKITTKEPDDNMIEVAIASLKGVLENE